MLLGFIAPGVRAKATVVTAMGTVAVGATGGSTSGGATGAMFAIIFGLFLRGYGDLD